MARLIRDITKALQAALANPISTPTLPKELNVALEAYGNKPDELEEEDRQALHKELLDICKKQVGTPKQHNAGDAAPSNDKLSTFIRVLLVLNAKIRRQEKLQDWYNLIVQPVLDGVGHTRDEISLSTELLLRMLIYDEDDDNRVANAKTSKHFLARTLEAYMRRTRLQDAEDEKMGDEDAFVARQLGDALVQFGQKMPKVRVMSWPISMTCTDLHRFSWRHWTRLSWLRTQECKLLAS